MGRDTNFYYSFLVLPAEKREAIVAVWDFCRAVDDAVDEAEGPGGSQDQGQGAEAEVARWRSEVAAVFEAGNPQTSQGRALRQLLPRFPLPRSAFDALIEGVEMDLAVRRYETFEDLHEYCIRVASAVGLMCLEIFGYEDPRSRLYATDLGVALQLTNILRDVPGDFERGRLYIPLEDLKRFGCTENDLRQEIEHAGAGVRSPAVKELLRWQGMRARQYYARASAALPASDARRLVAAKIMGAIYFGLLRRIERADYDVFSQVVRIPRPRRALIALATWSRTLVIGA
ncbi:MAG: squalene/phytoene synthase family protein [Vicinamibacterales bacterium]